MRRSKKMTEYRIVIDTREQKPLPIKHESIVAGLKTGDYSIQGYEDKFCVEHKTVADLIGTCDSGTKNTPDNRARFERELRRMKDGFDFYCIVISGFRRDILQECLKIAQNQRQKGKTRIIRPETRERGVIGSLKAFRADYNAHHYFLGTKENAAAWVEDQARIFMRKK